jgi:hypothetical protein
MGIVREVTKPGKGPKVRWQTSSYGLPLKEQCGEIGYFAPGQGAKTIPHPYMSVNVIKVSLSRRTVLGSILTAHVTTGVTADLAAVIETV